MSTKSVVVGFVMVLASTTGCGAPSDGDEPDELDESSSSEVSSALTPVDDMPSLPPPSLPIFEPRWSRPIWDLRHYLHDVEQPWFGNCYMYWLKLREPRGTIKEVPVTVCK